MGRYVLETLKVTHDLIDTLDFIRERDLQDFNLTDGETGEVIYAKKGGKVTVITPEVHEILEEIAYKEGYNDGLVGEDMR